MQHETHGTAPSAWIARFASALSPGARVMDVACGGLRHSAMFARRGCRVVAVDRTEPPAFAHEPWASQVRFLCADLENAAWPFGDDTFDAVVVTNYLFRPLMGRLIESLAPGGWLLYETFGEGNARFGRPSRADFLLRPGELLEVCRARLQVVAFEQGEATQPKPAVVQRIAARRAN